MAVLAVVWFPFQKGRAYRDPDRVTHRTDHTVKNLTFRGIRFSGRLGQSIWHVRASRAVRHIGKWGNLMPKASGSKPNALQKPLRPSEELAAVVGPSSLSRGEVVSKIWEYIRANNLQNPENRREILADDKLRKVFGKDKVTMFEMNKHLTQHLK